MVIIRCCSLVTPITAAMFAGCAKLPFPALDKPAEQKATGKEPRSLSVFVDVYMTVNWNVGLPINNG